MCLLWSIVNPAHELRVGELLDEQLPGRSVTPLAPAEPLPSRIPPRLVGVHRRIAEAGDGRVPRRLRAHASRAGLRRTLARRHFRGRRSRRRDVAACADPLASSPAPPWRRSPVASSPRTRRRASTAIVADTGGTSYDVSVVRSGQILWTRETWIGEPFFGHMTGFPSVDVRSVGAGGGSIASVDAAGLLRVGPESAGADPGPACYRRGGSRPTVTDACVVLGYHRPRLLPRRHVRLDRALASEAIESDVGMPLGLDAVEAAGAIMRVTTETMVGAIEEITIHQGIDPRAGSVDRRRRSSRTECSCDRTATRCPRGDRAARRAAPECRRRAHLRPDSRTSSCPFGPPTAHLRSRK